MLGLLVRSQVRFFLRRKLSALTVLLGITLGVASIVAVHQIGERIAIQLDASTPAHLRGAQFTLQRLGNSAPASSEAYFELRKRWRAGEVPGISGLVPVVHGVVALADVPDASSGSAQLVGLDWLQLLNGQVGQMPLLPASAESGAGAGSGLLQPSEGGPTSEQALPALVDQSLNLKQGQRFRAGNLRFEVAGILEVSQAPDSVASIYVDIGVAQEALGFDPDQLSMIALSREDPQQPLRELLEKVMPGISAGLPAATPPVLPQGWLAQGVADQMPQVSFGRSVLFNLGALGTLSLVVAWFLIYQTAVLWLRRQALVYQRLLHQGVTIHQLRFVFCASLLLVGLVAGVIGLGLGLGFAHWLLTLMVSGTDAEPLQQSLFGSFGVPVVVKALASAGLVSLFAALIAFRRLWRQDVNRLWAMGLGLVVLLLLILFGFWPGSGLVGAFVVIAVSCVLVLLLLRPLLELLRRRAVGVPGPLVWRMGVRELAWYPMDVAIALGAMVLAIATSVGVGTMVDSFRLDFDRMLNQRLAGDIQVRGDRQVIEPMLAALPGFPSVTQVRVLRSGSINLAGQPVQLGLTELDAVGAGGYSLADAVAPDSVLVNEQLARKLSLEVGMPLTVGGRQLQIAAIYPGYGDTQGRLVAQDDPAWKVSISRYQLQISASEPQALVQALQDEYSLAQIELRSSVRALALRIFDETFAITRALTYTALAVAAVGLYNALVGLSLLQQRSWRLLSVMGLAMSERLGFALSRSALIFCITTLLALPLGLFMGWVLCHIVNPRAFGWTVPLAWSPEALLLPVVVGALVALIAGLLSLPLQNAGASAMGDD